MINTPTVLILGAGSSAPYGLPTGEQLRKQILALVDEPIAIELFAELGYEESALKEFVEAFRRSGTNSVDSFLEHRFDLINIGKTAIAIVLMGCEDELKLHDGDWYRYLFSMLNTSFDDVKANKLSVLTFNYDRSFEEFLFTALKNLYGKTDSDCKIAVDAIPIIHLHGKAGNLPWQGSGRPYSALSLRALKMNKNRNRWIREAVEGIKIIHEDVKPSDEFEIALQKMQEADKIYFLGFGYHPKNIERLRIKKINSAKTKDLSGTSFHLTDSERKAVQDNLLEGKFDLHCDLNVKHWDTLEFLREVVNFQ